MTRLVTPADLAKLQTLMDPESEEGEFDDSLSGYAAAAAIKDMLPNWTDAQHDATGLNDFNTGAIIADIDDLIGALGHFRTVATEALS